MPKKNETADEVEETIEPVEETSEGDNHLAEVSAQVAAAEPEGDQTLKEAKIAVERDIASTNSPVRRDLNGALVIN